MPFHGCFYLLLTSRPCRKRKPILLYKLNLQFYGMPHSTWEGAQKHAWWKVKATREKM